MPKLVSELITGKSFERSSENGRLADSCQRQWRILMNVPSESFNISDVIGVKIGDALSVENPIPCVNISVAADGENKMVRLVTARYASTPGEETQDNKDPGTVQPSERTAIVKVSTSMVELPAWTWYKVSAGGDVNGARVAAVNPAKDMYEGVLKIEPIVIITVEQFDYPTDPTQYCQHVGKVNSNQATWRGLTIPKRCLLFRGVSFEPQNLFWGSALYRGWKSSYEFALRYNKQTISDGGQQTAVWLGWDVGQPQTGFNYIDAGGVRQRAWVKATGSDQQIPSAQPVRLNDDGSMRADNANPLVLVYRYGVHEEADFSTALGHLRLSEGS